MSHQPDKFTRLGFFRTYVLPSLLLFLLPVFSWWFFSHVEADYDQQFLAGIRNHISTTDPLTDEQRAQLIEAFQTLPVSERLASGDSATAQMVSPNAQLYYSIFKWMIRIAVACILSGVGALLLAGLSVLLSFRSQSAQYYSFSVGFHLLRVFATFQVLAQGTLLVALSFWVTAYWFDSYYIKLVVVAGLLAGGAALAIIGAIFRKLDDTFVVHGCLIERTPESKLWQELDRICQRVGTAPPDRVIAGIDNNFFVTEHPVTLNGHLCAGRTLYVSLPLLKALDGSQAAAVMAHEMAHFSGNDTLYSRKTSPLINRFDVYLQALSAGITIPIFYFMVCFRALFQISLGKLRKEREFRADRIAAEISSPRDIADSLLRITAYSEYRGKVEQELFKSERSHSAVGISERVEQGFKAFANGFITNGNLEELETSHPFDSHPPTKARWAAVGVEMDGQEMRKVLDRDADARWYHNIGNAADLEREQWKVYEEGFQKMHEQNLAFRYVPETEEERALVVKYFPPVSLLGKKEERLDMDHEAIHFSEWDDPIKFSEIIECRGEQNALGKPQIRIDYQREGKQSRVLRVDLFKEEQARVMNEFNRFYSRHMTMREYRKELASTAASGQSSPPEPL